MPFLVIPYPHIDPVLVHIGPLAIRWYALAYIFGILLGWAYARALVRSERLWGGKPPISVTDFDDFVLWVTLGIILGGRIGYVLFYNLPFFAAHPLQIFELWTGGMSFHGGFTGCVVAVILFARSRGIPILSLGDVTCAVGPIGLFFGRLANFVNGELWGRPTNVPWAMVFPRAPDQLPRHPSQLYECFLEGIVLFLIVQFCFRVLRWQERPGLIAATFFTGYGLFRFFVEFYREPDAPLLGWFTMGMALCVPLVLVGLLVYWIALRQPRARTAE